MRQHVRHRWAASGRLVNRMQGPGFNSRCSPRSAALSAVEVRGYREVTVTVEDDTLPAASVASALRV
jgi:hypothetical protein